MPKKITIRRPGRLMLDMAINHLVEVKHCPPGHNKCDLVCHECWTEYLKWEIIYSNGELAER